MDTVLADEWAFTPASLPRIKPPGRVAALAAGLIAAALIGFLVLRVTAGGDAPAETEVLGASETRAEVKVPKAPAVEPKVPQAEAKAPGAVASGGYTVNATAVFAIVDRHEDGSTIVDVTLEKVLSEQGGELNGKTLRIGVAPEGRLGSVTGLDGVALDPSTTASSLVGDVSGADMVAGHSWTGQVSLTLVEL